MKYECSFAGVTLCSEPEKFYTRITVNGMSREFCGMPYLPINADEKKIKNISGVLEQHKKIGDRELLRHEIVDGDPMHQRSAFDSPNGEITAEVDFRSRTVSVKE